MSKSHHPPTNDFYAPLERYKPYLSPEEFAKLQEASQQPAKTAVRVNLLKSPQPQADLQRWVEAYGWETLPIPFCPPGRMLLNYAKSPSQTVEHRLGYYYLQDAASMLPVSLFNPTRKGNLTLDMAASPGGKTTQLVDTNYDHDFIVANDSSASRLQALKVVLQTWGAVNTVITNYPGEKLGDWFPETFDRVLLDAPCSMESLRVSVSHPHRSITASERQRLASRQLALLESAVKAARLGGEIVYSTCTMAPEEDEIVLDTFFETHPGVIRVEKTVLENVLAPGLNQFENRQFDPQVAKSLRIWPFIFDTNGFFTAKLTKLKPMPSDDLVKPDRPFVSTGLSPLTSSEERVILDHMVKTYEFDLQSCLEEFSLALYQRDKNIFVIPLRYLQHFSNLPYYALGMPAGRLLGSAFGVSVDFVSRFGDAFRKNAWIIPDNLIDEWLTGADLRNFTIEGCQTGSIVAVRDGLGRNLGAGKNLPNRLRNLLPNRNIRFK